MRFRRTLSLALLAGLVSGSSAMAYAATTKRVEVIGRQPDGSVLTSVLQHLTPVGKQIEFPGRANRSAVSPDGKTLAVIIFESDKDLVLIDLASGKVRQRLNPGGAASSDGIAWTPNGRSLLTSLDNGNVGITPISAAGLGGTTVQVPMPTVKDALSSDPVANGIAVSTDGRTAYIALSRSNSLAVLDLATRTVTKQIAVGNAPHSVLLDGGKAYVSDEGGRPAVASDTTDDSGGTQIVTNGPSSGASTGTIDVVDLASGTTKRVAVGLHPGRMTRSGRYLFVVNANSDTVSVLDTATDAVVSTIDLQPFPSAPYGSSPTDVAVVGGHEVFVTLGRNNAVAAYDWQGPTEPARMLGLLPVEEYPSSIQAVGTRLVVTNLKGVGSVEDADAGNEARTVGAVLGSVSLVPLPSSADLARGTKQVAINNSWNTIQKACPRTGVAPVAIPARLGEPSTIKHVVYIIKENRTYDQVLGDIGRGSSDKKLAEFGKAVTPNQHALATRWPLFDNYYASGRRSNDGHNWAMQSDVPDYLEMSLSSRRADTLTLGDGTPPSSGWDSLLYLPSGFLWENALKAGLTFADFGEYTSEDINPPARTDINSLRPYVAPEFPGFNLDFPDVTRAQLFKDRLTTWSATGSMPSLTTLTLSNDHTGGSDPQYPTPDSQVADNDLGTGRIIEALSKSPFWSSTQVFVEEDDAQGGPDHVDGHRSTLFMAGPYTKRGGLIHTPYNQVNVIKTIEQILGLPAMNQLDLAAQPIREAFTNTPDLTPFTAIKPASTPNGNVPLKNLSGIQKEWAIAEGFQDLRQLDAANEQILNRDDWYVSTGWKRPYPGDTRILHPWEGGPSQRGQGLLPVSDSGERPVWAVDKTTGSRLRTPLRVVSQAAVPPGCAGSVVTVRQPAVTTAAAGGGRSSRGSLAATGISASLPVAGLVMLGGLMVGFRRR